MAARTTDPSIPVALETGERQRPADCVADVEAATESLARSLTGLQILAEQPGYEFVDRLLTGYLWSIEQIREVTANLKDELENLEGQTKSLDPCRTAE